ncbi:MAG: hypothetical protein JW829_10830 [Pirellulales bacterium]|nr:hypothetical protein [Pirellulales bacterium]
MNRSRPVFQLSLFLGAFFVVWTLRATVFYGIDESMASPAWRTAYASLVKLLLWVVPAVVYARYLRGPEPMGYLGISNNPNKGQWLWSLSIWPPTCAHIANNVLSSLLSPGQ